MDLLIKSLRKAGFTDCNLKLNEPMKLHTSFKVGGAADIFIEPEDIEQLITACRIVKDRGIPYTLIGNGSNLLVSDQGIRGVVLKIGEEFGNYSADGEIIISEAGVLLSTLSKFAAKK